MSAINNALLERARALIHPSATDAEVINAALKEFVDRAVKRLTRKARSHGMPTGTRYAGESFEAWDLKNRYREHMERQRARLERGR